MRDDFQWPSDTEAELHIRNELSRLGIAFRENRNFFNVTCPFPHDGAQNVRKNFGIAKNGKSSKCFVCGDHGSWQKVADVFGAAKFGGSGLLDESGADLNLARLIQSRFAAAALSDDDDVDVPSGLEPWLGSWRGMPEDFLRAVSARKWWQTMTKDDRSWTTERIWFPCLQAGQYVGYVARRLDKSDIARYYNAPWMKSGEVYFPFDYTRSLRNDSVFIVEGPVDALKLLSHGVPALAVLGAENLGEKHHLLPVSGYKKAYVLFDNDDAGRKATPEAYAKLRSVLPTEVVTLPPNRNDPGELEPREIAWLGQLMVRNHP